MVVRLAAWIVPQNLRPSWLEEWRSELVHESRRGGATSRTLVGYALGAFADARAVRATARQFGGLRRSPGLGEALRMVMHELRYGSRGLLRAPGFTAVAVLTLGIALGANTAIFALVDRVILSPLPYPESDRLVRIAHPVPGMGVETEWRLSEAGYFDMRARARTLEQLGVYRRSELNLSVAEAPERVVTVSASETLLRVLGARALHGRLYRSDEDVPGGPTIAVLSHGLWLRRFGGDGGIIGGTVRLDGIPFEVIGVLPPAFDLPEGTVDVWMPLRLDPAAPPMNSHYLSAIGLRSPNASLAQVQADLERVVGGFPERFPQAYSPGFMTDAGFGVVVRDLREDIVGDFRTVLWILLAAVVLVLAIACANVVNLFLVRTESRAREVAVRSALGASTRNLATFFFAESLVLAVFAALAGVGLALASVQILVAVAPSGIPRLEGVAVDRSSIMFAIGLAVLVSAALAMFPLVRFGRHASARELVSGRGTTVSRQRNAIQGGLVIAQVALALVLLVSAGLLLASFQRLRAVDPGFNAEGILTFDVALPRALYSTNESVSAFHHTLRAQLGELPGVSSVSGTNALPLIGPGTCVAQYVVLDPVLSDPGRVAPCFPMHMVLPGWFETMNIPIVAGRPIEPRDDQLRTGAAVVSRALAERLWPDMDPIGQRLGPFGDNDEPFYTVVGVAGAVRQRGLDQPASEIVYYPLLNIEGKSWNAPRYLAVVVKVRSGNPVALMDQVRRTIARLDRDVAVANVRTMRDVVAESTARSSFAMLLLGVAAGIALLLGAVGLYGVVSYVVGQRTREIGVRLALGARIGEVALLVLGRSMRLALAGIVLGIAGALAATRVLESLLYDVSATDPLTIGAVSALLLGVALLASWMPARRAARVDPIEVLRMD